MNGQNFKRKEKQLRIETGGAHVELLIATRKVFWNNSNKEDIAVVPNHHFSSWVIYLGNIWQLLAPLNISFMDSALSFFCGFRRTCCYSGANLANVDKFVGEYPALVATNTSGKREINPVCSFQCFNCSCFLKLFYQKLVKD